MKSYAPWGFTQLALLTTCLLALSTQAQTTLVLQSQADAVVGFHDGFNSANNNYGTANHYSATSQPSAAGSGENTSRSLVVFDLSGIPAGATLLLAELNLYGRGPIGPGAATSIGNTGDNLAYIQRITSNWVENTVTWNTQPTTTVTNQVTIGPYAAVSEDVDVNVTQLVADMLANPAASYGFELRLITEDPTRHIGFWSREATDPALRPTLTLTFDVPCDLVTNIELTQLACDLSYAHFYANTSGGNEPYTYNWSDGSDVSSYLSVSPTPGLHSVTVTDANGCTASDSVALIVTPVNLIIEGNTSICPDGTTQLCVLGDYSEFSWTANGNELPDTIACITAAAAWTYQVFATAVEGCIATASVIVTVNDLDVSIAAANSECGSLPGTLTALGEGGITPYTYVWGTGATTQSIAGAVGSFSVTVTDAAGCTADDSIDINGTINTITLPVTADAAFGFHDGFNSANNNYGTDPHILAMSQPSASGSGENTARAALLFDLGALPAGATVVSASLNLYGSGPTGPAGSGDAVSVGNTGDNVTYIQRVISPWSENAITWNTQPTTTTDNQVTVGPVAAISADLNIDVTQLVLDMLADPANSFGFEMRLVTEDPTRNLSFRSREFADSSKHPTLTIVLAGATSNLEALISIDSTNCDLSYVVLTANGSGGTAPYSYNWSTGATTQSIVSDGAVFSVTVTDANGCSDADTIYLLPTPPVFTEITGDLTVCPGATTTLTASPDGMTGYLWSNGETTQSITVGAGSYSVTVFAGICSVGFAEATVSTNPVPTLSTVVTNASVGNNGAINLNVSGGGSPFTFAWSNGATTEDITGLAPGTYSVTVSTADGCTVSTEATVTQTTGCGLTVNVLGTNLTCYGSKNGSATAVATGAAGPFTYVWSNGKTTSTVIKLTAGTYSVTVTAANGCTATGSVLITQPSNILAYITCIKVCPGACNGSATVNIVSGGAAPFTYAWNNGQTTSTANGLCAGVYWVTITDANNCKKIVGTAVTTTTVGCGLVARMDSDENYTPMALYPNPADQIVHIVSPSYEGTATLRVVNALGQTVVALQVTNEITSVDVSQWAAGVYHVQFESNGSVEATKFIKH